MRIVHLQNESSQLSTPITARYCDSFWPRFRGLMLQSHLDENEGLVLVDTKDNRTDSAIHMLFMNIDLAVVWINSQNTVVDVQFAKKWHPFYIPKAPACLVLETHPSQLQHFKVGDKIQIENA